MASDCPYFCTYNIEGLGHQCRQCKTALYHADCSGSMYGTCDSCAELLERQGI